MKRPLPILLLAASRLLPAATGAQQPADMTSAVEEANRELDEWIEETRAFVGDERFDAGDLESFLEHYEAFSSVGEEMSDDGEFVDYDEVLANPEYRSWAAASGLAAEPWLKKSMRIIAFTMRNQMEDGFARAEAQFPEQRSMIDEQCAQAGPEMCQQMKASLAAAMEMFEQQKKRLENLPQPTAAEQALLERYADDLAALMESGEEEDWEEEEDWGE